MKVLISIRWEGERAEATLTDVSLGGAGVRSDAKIPEGVVLELEFRPGDEGTVVGVNRAIVRSVQADEEASTVTE